MLTSKSDGKILLLTMILSIVLFKVQAQTQAPAQNVVINSIQAALKKGNASEIVKSCNTMVELGFNGEKANYNKTQAEFVLKDFFKNNPPTDFQYIHQGSSKEGLIYAIGKYTSKDVNYRVLIFLKQFKGSYLIDTLGFSKE